MPTGWKHLLLHGWRNGLSWGFQETFLGLPAQKAPDFWAQFTQLKSGAWTFNRDINTCPAKKRKRGFFFLKRFHHCLNGKRGSATTGAGGTWILDNKLSALGILLIVNFCSGQVLETHRVDQKFHSVLFHYGIVFAC